MKKYITEKPFDNKYWDCYKEGIYVDSINGKALFLSKDKYNSNTGWPAFSKCIDETLISRKAEIQTNKPPAIEVSHNGNHLGHVFEDGITESKETFCINSYSLRFICIKEMEKFGYEKYLNLLL